MPRQRLNLADYGDLDRQNHDTTYLTHAALLEDYSFDWRSNRIPKSAFEATDIAHWLALDVARQAVDDAGIDLDAVDRSRIGTVVGNSLTGEISRTHLIRLRWPYVRQVIVQSARAAGMSDDQLTALLRKAEPVYKAPFHQPNEDTLAGALANVIAGRICNRLDLHGGGYTVDGACASSLLAVKTGCDLIRSGDLDIVLAGGVDISLDPLELVGFSRLGALSPGVMRVYDKASQGFIPGEGCGFVVLVRSELARELGLAVWARVEGVGISSDGYGGITAPKSHTQALALQRCYAGAPFDAADLDFIEGHGTGTPVGDEVELGAILSATARAGAEEDVRAIGVTSVKTLIGHTKAAAGVAGLLKAILGVNQRVLPPMAGPETPADSFRADGARIFPLRSAIVLDEGRPVRAGVSGAGFGGINCHIAVSSENVPMRPLVAMPAGQLAVSPQRSELLVASATTANALVARLSELAERAAGMAEGELVDFAADTAMADRQAPVRIALPVATAAAAEEALRAAATALADGTDRLANLPERARFGVAEKVPRIGLLFPGQGSQFLTMGERLRHRHAWAQTRARRWDADFAHLTPDGLSDRIARPMDRCFDDDVRAGWEGALRDTRAAQPAIAMVALQWFDWLSRLGIEAAGVAGHSLGEIPALVAADLLNEREAMALLKERAENAAPTETEGAGAMVSLRCDAATGEELCGRIDGYAVLANLNAPDQTVLAGEPAALERLAEIARGEGIQSTMLNVANAFHSRYMAGAARALERLADRRGGEVRVGQVPFYSALQGQRGEAALDPYAYLAEQVTGPVRFADAVTALGRDVDMLIELGPGEVLTNLAKRALGADYPAFALEAMGFTGDAKHCEALGALFCAGAAIDWRAVYDGRLVRPFVPASKRLFLQNPCEFYSGDVDTAALAKLIGTAPPIDYAGGADCPADDAAPVGGAADVAAILRELVAAETGFDAAMMPDDAWLTRDLNLDSIKLGEIRGRLRNRGITFENEGILGEASIAEIAAAAVVADAGSTPAATAEGAGPAAVNVVGAAPTHAAMASERLMPVLGLALKRDEIALPSERVSASAPIWLLRDDVDAPAAERLDAALQALGYTVTTATPDAELPAMLDSAIWLQPAGTPASEAAAMAAAGRWAALSGRFAVVSLQDTPPIGARTLAAAAVAQSIALEQPSAVIISISAALDQIVAAARWMTAALPAGVLPLSVDGFGKAWRMRLDRWRAPDGDATVPVGASDAVIVTGGAKGITAECALALARETGAAMALAGSSAPEDAEVQATLGRFRKLGLRAIYVRGDVSEPAAAASLVAAAKAELGVAALAGFVHGAGVNKPAAVGSLNAVLVERELAIKVAGFENVLAALDPASLRLCIAFGSVIGVTGLHGNAGYALANARLAERVADLRKAYPAVRCACLAYGVWRDVGMGAKLGVINRLAEQNVHAIPVGEGIEWFLRAARAPDPPLPLTVSAPMPGLPTWQAARGEIATGGEFLADIQVWEPDGIVVGHRTLTRETAPWLADHDFNGSLLLPMVFAVRGMGEAAAALGNSERVAAVNDFQIVSAIVVPAETGVILETLAELTDAGEYRASVRAMSAPAAQPNFAGIVELAPGETAPAFEPVWPSGQEVAAELSDRLYDWLLFQGPAFRRIARLSYVDLSDDVCRRAFLSIDRDAADGAATPDPFFCDSLLQAMQILVPKDICLPNGVAQIVFRPGAYLEGEALVRSEILERTEEGYLGRVTAVDPETGELLALIDGLRLAAATRRGGRPDLSELLQPVEWDRAQVAGWNRSLASDFGVAAELRLASIDDAAAQGERREAARELLTSFAPQFAEQLEWHTNGAPVLAGNASEAVSIAHESGRLLMAVGDKVAGCDLQAIRGRAAAWRDVLPTWRIDLWRQLSTALGDPSYAGGLVWALDEALVKAGQSGAVAEIAMREGDTWHFRADEVDVYATVVELATAGPTALAIAFDGGGGPRADVQFVPTSTYGGQSSSRVTHFTTERQMTFREALPPLGSAPAPIFFDWMGALREQAMGDIRVPLTVAFLEQGKGILTNETAVRVHRPPAFTEPLQAWVWLDRVLESAPSTFDLRFAWAQLDGQNDWTLNADGQQRLTWVAMDEGGVPTVEAFPPFFADFIAARTPTLESRWLPPVEIPPAEPRAPPSINGAAAHELTVPLDESDSNLVGNIYFARFASLIDRAARRALVPTVDVGTGFYCTDLRLTHLGEAMPGDTVTIAARTVANGAGMHRVTVEIRNTNRDDKTIATASAIMQEVAKPSRHKPSAAITSQMAEKSA